MLSGIGPADHLREHGVEVLVDSPNVGAHLQEHPMAFFNWRTAGDTLDDADHPRYLLPWLIAGKGKLSSTIAEAAIHWRSDASLPAPDFQFLLGSGLLLGARLPQDGGARDHARHRPSWGPPAAGR